MRAEVTTQMNSVRTGNAEADSAAAAGENSTTAVRGNSTAAVGENSSSDPVRCTLRIRLQRDEPFWGIGVSQLLHGIEKTHSLRAAAQNMRISYSKAWKILHEAEMALDTPLLNSTTGGQDGGGSSLTDYARRLLYAYDDMMEQTNAVMQRCYKEKIFPILTTGRSWNADDL